MTIDDVDPAVVAAIVARIHEWEPETCGIFVFGSYAAGTATRASDLDLRALTPAPRVDYRTWFVDDLHVSVGARTLARQLARREEPAAWSLGFPVASPARWVWRTEEAVAALGDPPVLRQPAAEPQLEDFFEATRKALGASEPLALRVAARSAGELAPRLLIRLNAAREVVNRVDAVRAATELAVAPRAWRDDLLRLLALAPASDDEIRDAVGRLARGTLGLLRERAPDVDPQPELPRYLADGTLERHLGFADQL
jgi:hypothetical protein